MDAVQILNRLRKAEAPDADQIEWFCQGLANGRVSDAQAGAFAMAVCQNGLTEGMRVTLTQDA